MTTKQTNRLLWIPKLIAALIMLQTLYFKFSAAPESIYIFTAIGMEPWGRIGTGIMELIASILILIPAATVFGAVLGIGLMGGALFFHITRLGIVVQNDGGLLFIYAMAVMICCIALVCAKREQLFFFLKKSKIPA
jgi:uncharacterized membrane protein YphA (DoxX/SURF4 family)